MCNILTRKPLLETEQHNTKFGYASIRSEGFQSSIHIYVQVAKQTGCYCQPSIW